MDGRTVGCLGGGQLGRMMAEAGHRLGIRMAILDPMGNASPAGLISDLSIEGSFDDPGTISHVYIIQCLKNVFMCFFYFFFICMFECMYVYVCIEKIKELAAVSDIITIEIEHVDTKILHELVANGYTIHPHPSVISIIQDKYKQKEYLESRSIPIPEYMDTPNIQDVERAGELFGYPFMLKKKRLAYDGRGNCVVKDAQSVEASFDLLGGVELYAEKMVPFVKELAIMVVKTNTGVIAYPVVETIQKNNVCDYVLAPAQISAISTQLAVEVASAAIASFEGYGIYGVELFLLADDTILLNEIAPRPHNSGHYTMESCSIDQFEMHLRCILQLPTPIPTMNVKVALMKNILGTSDSMDDATLLCKQALAINGAGIHWYGKSTSRIGRKMAHFTLTATSMTELKKKADILHLDTSHGVVANGPRVGVIMGSDSDLATMSDACAILDEFGIEYECTVISAHRTPSRMYTYAQSAIERGLCVIIAGAGGAAHLPGMVAALTPLPVIGVPVKSSTLSGNDSLLSIVQMPKGIPVATVAIGNATNAALLAIRILGASDDAILSQMEAYMSKQEEDVLRKAVILETMGYKEYQKTYFKV